MLEKNVKKELAKRMRGISGFNTGIRTHKSPKYPTRQDVKNATMKEINNWR